MGNNDKEFIEGMNIIAKYILEGSDYNIAAEHDTIYYGTYECVTDEKDIKRLEELGWYEDEDSWAYGV